MCQKLLRVTPLVSLRILQLHMTNSLFESMILQWPERSLHDTEYPFQESSCAFKFKRLAPFRRKIWEWWGAGLTQGKHVNACEHMEWDCCCQPSTQLEKVWKSVYCWSRIRKPPNLASFNGIGCLTIFDVMWGDITSSCNSCQLFSQCTCFLFCC